MQFTLQPPVSVLHPILHTIYCFPPHTLVYWASLTLYFTLFTASHLIPSCIGPASPYTSHYLLLPTSYPRVLGQPHPILHTIYCFPPRTLVYWASLTLYFTLFTASHLVPSCIGPASPYTSHYLLLPTSYPRVLGQPHPILLTLFTASHLIPSCIGPASPYTSHYLLLPTSYPRVLGQLHPILHTIYCFPPRTLVYWASFTLYFTLFTASHLIPSCIGPASPYTSHYLLLPTSYPRVLG